MTADPASPDVARRQVGRQFEMPRAYGDVRRRMLAQLVLVGVGQSACVVAFAFLLHVLVDHVEHYGRISLRQAGIYAPIARWHTSWLLIALAVVSAATVVVKALSEPMAERLAQSYVHSVRIRLFEHVSNSPSWAANRRAIGVTVLRFTGDSTALRNWAGRGVAFLLVDGVFVVCTMGVLVIMLPPAGIAAATYLVFCLVVALLLGRRLRGSVREARRQTGRLATFVNERVTQAAVMQSLGRVGRERRALSRRSQQFSQAMVRQARFVGILGATAEAARIGIVVTVIGAAVAVGAQTDTIASLVSIAGFLGGPLNSLAQAQEAWQRSQIARRRISEVIGAPARLSAPVKAPKLADGPGRLELGGLRLTDVLEPASTVVTPGQRVAVYGPPGGGKSLLLATIARLHSTDDGLVLLDGEDLAVHDPVSVGRTIRLVSPDLPLLRGTVEANLRHGEVSEKDLGGLAVERLRALSTFREHLDQTLAEILPNGLTTRVGEGGHGLSRVARYQVTLARALRSGPRVLLLDWPEVETALCRDLLEGLFANYPGTLIYVTSDVQLRSRADLHWRVDGILTATSGSRSHVLRH